MWGPRAGGKRGKTQRRGQGRREQSPRPLGPARAGVSVATVPPAGQVSVITELRGLPPPRGMGTAEKHRSVHTYIPLPPSLMQAWEEVGALASPGDVAGIQRVQRGCRGASGWGGVGLG